MFNPSLPQSSSCSEGRANTINPSVAIPSMVPSGVGDVGGHTSTAPKSGGPHISSPGAGVSNAPGMPQPGCMAYLWESFSSRGVSPEASAFLLETSPVTTQHLLNGLCHEQNKDPTFGPTVGPIEDVVNFLSELFSKVYQYRSLNSYHSAISAVHHKVDGYSVGQHPLVLRLLKDAFNERPPLSRYSFFWNVDVVLAHLKGLGSNGSLSLKILTLKTAMHMALARPARSADLASLDVHDQSITDEGIVFLPRHLSKLRSLFRTSFTQDFQKMKSCVLYKLCWLMRIILQLLGYLRGRILFFFYHGLENMSQYPVVPSLDG